MGQATIDDLPDPIIEYILSYLSPYRDLKQCMLVCRAWQKHVQGVVRKIQRDFNCAISTMKVQWCHLIAEPGPTISKRYSHSACCVGNSMYIFGGCTTANTTFNDLWRLDLGSRCWIRPLATGTYPPPKACATLVAYEDNLVLFGGWTHTSPYPLHQVWRIFNHLHMYNTNTNRWTQIVTPTNSPSMAGHSATVHGDLMVVFGGIQRQTGESPSSRLSVFYSSNDVWVLNLKTFHWRKQPTSAVQPMPRYGHSQIHVDDKHLLIMGGCGGPNMLFSDIWLLTLSDNPDEPWQWREMDVRLRENSAPHLAFHPACKVGNQVVVMSKAQKSRTSPSSLPHLLRAPSRIWVPPYADNTPLGMNSPPQRTAEVDPCVNGKKGVLKRQFERRHQSSSSGGSSRASSSDEEEFQTRDLAKKLASSPGVSLGATAAGTLSQQQQQQPTKSVPCTEPSTSGVKRDSSSMSPPSPSSAGSPRTSSGTHGSSDGSSLQAEGGGSSAFGAQRDASEAQSSRPISVRPNARRNRQRQLEGLDRMEQRLRDLRAGSSCRPLSVMITNQNPPNPHFGSARNPMCLYVLDISSAASTGTVTWKVIKKQSLSAPEEIILYSLVLGRGELIMFGGIQKDLNSRQQEGDTVPEIVSNALHFMSAQRFVI